jgi:hypothetical protein
MKTEIIETKKYNRFKNCKHDFVKADQYWCYCIHCGLRKPIILMPESK